jgi:hypothetical protein
MTDEDLINERLLAVLQLLDSIPLSSPEQDEQMHPELMEAAARTRRSGQ